MLPLNAYAFEHQIWVRYEDQILVCYRAHPTQKYPYIYPVAGPVTRLPLTSESGYQYPHHRSLLFACDRISGGNFWQEGVDRGQIVSRKPSLQRVQGEHIEFTDACDWRVPGQPAVLTDERLFTVSMPSPELLIIDASIKVTAVQEAHVRRTNHSLFALRVAPDLTPNGGGVLVNAEGLSGEQATFGQMSNWCGFHAQRGDVVEGIALLDHPQNPWTSRWFTRDYGFCSPTPVFWFDDEGRILPAGTSFLARYRVIAHAGTPIQAGIQDIYAEWCI